MLVVGLAAAPGTVYSTVKAGIAAGKASAKAALATGRGAIAGAKLAGRLSRRAASGVGSLTVSRESDLCRELLAAIAEPGASRDGSHGLVTRNAKIAWDEKLNLGWVVAQINSGDETEADVLGMLSASERLKVAKAASKRNHELTAERLRRAGIIV